MLRWLMFVVAIGAALGETLMFQPGEHLKDNAERKQCPDGRTCLNYETCCPAQKGYTCCPFSDAVCCSDKKHCCAEGYHCNPAGGSCTKKIEEHLTWARLRTSSHDQTQVVPKETKLDKSEKSEVVRCPDGTICPNFNTCCPGLTGRDMCCPLSRAVCCADGIHCCPAGKTCDPSSHSCLSGTRIPWLKKLTLVQAEDQK